MTDTDTATHADPAARRAVDVAVVGAGFAGLYLLHRLRAMGLSAVCFEKADGVGGTWYWNRYPGARCDVESLDYSYSFDADLEAEWTWSERYATQPEILRYLEHVADRFELRRDIRFETTVERADWDEAATRWRLQTSAGDEVVADYYVMATGCLSMPKDIDIDGAESFAGEVYHTSRWPHDGVDFTGKRVAIIGTGSSAIQSIPLIAAQAESLTVFQRTANFSVPAHNGPHRADKAAELAADRQAYRDSARWSRSGVPLVPPEIGALMVSDEERQATYEAGWAIGGIFGPLNTYMDLLTNKAANDTLAEFIRSKIRETVDDPEMAEILCPTTFPVGTKRVCVDTNYYETFNQPHVSLVDLTRDPIGSITATGVDTAEGSHTFDALVFATGFDAMTGAIVAVDINGRDGVSLAERWADGPRTYLGLMSVDFPNLFMITGPGSPSVLSNMVVSIEQHVDWICDTVTHLRSNGLETIEPTQTAQDGWVRHANDFADITLFPLADSWYMGANVPGKSRVCLPYVGGVDGYRQVCDDVAAGDYVGFRLAGPAGEQAVDGLIRELMPDVGLLLEAMAEMGLPPLDSLSPEDARAFMAAAATQRAPGPDVGEIVEGTYPGAEGELAYRLYRPATPGPHPVVAYFHGGGWVLGDTDSDDPMCRDLCVKADALVVSFDYRHAPEHVFPAAPDDAVAAVRWLAECAESLGGDPSRLAVAGWSAGANLAAVTCQTIRDEGGPSIAGQVLLCPVTDGAGDYRSMTDNADGFVLTASLMSWFWDHYLLDPEHRSDPKASPLQAESLAGLPPALVVTAQFDPLRDEGNAYAAALSAAGVPTEHLEARGQIHTSPMAVDVLISPTYIRDEMAGALRRFLGIA